MKTQWWNIELVRLKLLNEIQDRTNDALFKRTCPKNLKRLIFNLSIKYNLVLSDSLNLTELNWPFVRDMSDPALHWTRKATVSIIARSRQTVNCLRYDVNRSCCADVWDISAQVGIPVVQLKQNPLLHRLRTKINPGNTNKSPVTLRMLLRKTNWKISSCQPARFI